DILPCVLSLFRNEQIRIRSGNEMGVKQPMKVLCSILFLLLANTLAYTQISPHTGSSYIPQRVYDSNEKRFSDFEAMLADLARYDVVFVGEQHDDPATHRLERAILEGLARRRENIIVAMEMFERDVQQTVDDYLAGRVREEDFISGSRPWPGYLTDYRPLVELARIRNWRVIASNTPRRIASQYSKKGLEITTSLSEADRKFVSADIKCPFDDYFKRFSAVMNQGHPAHSDNEQQDKKQDDEQKAMIERFYYAQCVKDETMAESIANQFVQNDSGQPRPLVVHFNGIFHSDYRLGAAARAVRRLSKSKVKVLSVVPVENLDLINVDEYRKRGDYVVFSLKPAMVKNAQVK